METYYDFIINYLIELDDIELIDQWNGYCLECSSDDYISYNNEYFFEEYFSNNVNEAVKAVCYGDFNYTDTYVQFNGYANLVTSDCLDDLVSISDLANYLEYNGFLEDEYSDHVEENQEV